MSVGPNEHRVLLTPCYVLHQRPYRESSVLLDVFSREYGRITLIARGLKRKKTASSQVLRAFTPMLISWQGLGELKTLTDAELIPPLRSLQNKALFCGLYLNELLLYLLYPFDSHPELYDCYVQTLQNLDEANMLDVELRYFELVLLDLLGYLPAIDCEADTGHAIQSDRFYHYQVEQGLILLTADGPSALAGASLIALAANNLTDKRSRNDAKRLMRQLLDYHLDGRELKSRKIFSQSTQ